jgi:hypothetical protein
MPTRCVESHQRQHERTRTRNLPDGVLRLSRASGRSRFRCEHHQLDGDRNPRAIPQAEAQQNDCCPHTAASPGRCTMLIQQPVAYHTEPNCDAPISIASRRSRVKQTGVAHPITATSPCEMGYASQTASGERDSDSAGSKRTPNQQRRNIGQSKSSRMGRQSAPRVTCAAQAASRQA